MSNRIERALKIADIDYALYAVSGVVLDAKQRSDTYVSGSGSSQSISGHGGGSAHITSRVVVTTNFWIRNASGQERNFQFGQNLPVREGNIVHVIYFKDEPFYFYNQTADEYFFLGNMPFFDKGIFTSIVFKSVLPAIAIAILPFIAMEKLHIIGPYSAIWSWLSFGASHESNLSSFLWAIVYGVISFFYFGNGGERKKARFKNALSKNDDFIKFLHELKNNSASLSLQAV